MRNYLQSAFRLHKVAHIFIELDGELDGRIGVLGLQRGPYSPVARRAGPFVTSRTGSQKANSDAPA